ncbi:MAG: hypothetical protein KDI09_18640 [Halioglobus sp.]|nr:hypothetical protein [Halioglobus sp.]
MNRMTIPCLLFAVVAVAQAQVRIKPPSATKVNPALQKQALSETARKALEEAGKSRAYPVRAEINRLGDTTSLLPGFGASPADRICGRNAPDSSFMIVRLHYEWRPGDSYVPRANLVVRKSDGDVLIPVTLRAGSGIAEAGVAGRPFEGLLALSKADLCPGACIDVRLAPRDAADANRFDQRWQRACFSR